MSHAAAIERARPDAVPAPTPSRRDRRNTVEIAAAVVATDAASAAHLGFAFRARAPRGPHDGDREEQEHHTRGDHDLAPKGLRR